MEFLKVCQFVNEKLKKLTLEEKISLFSLFFKNPVDYIDGVYFFNGKESTQTIVSDYISIRSHWMGMHEYDKLFLYFKNKEEIDK